MEVNKYLDFRLFGLTGSILMIISEFLPWFSTFSMWDWYIISISVAIEDSFLYLFPVICGVICLIGSILILYDKEYRINTVIINFIGLGFLLMLLAEMIPDELIYLANAGIGFYLCVAGFLLIIIDIIHILMSKE